MQRFQSLLNLQRALRLNEFMARKNLHVTVCCSHILSLTQNETCYFKRGLALKHGNACNKILQVNDIWLMSSRNKKKKSQKNVKAEMEAESDTESDVEEEEEDEEEESELDYDSPLVHKDMVVNSLRVDTIIAKGLKMSKHEAETMFYGSKFLLNGQKLLKKGIKLKPGDIVDIVTERTLNKLFVKRVKVLKLDGKSAAGNDKVHIRMWRDPFEIDVPPGYHDREDDVKSG